MRGRGGNNNRKGPNPLSRSYESNGPDVKIRGTAQQVADKYATLARDAHSSGDRVMAENYLQHAEHYNRIIAAAQAQQQQQSGRDNRDDRDDRDDADDENNEREAAENSSNRQPQQQRVEDGSGPQPEIEGVPAELALKNQVPSESKANGHAEGANGTAEEEPAPAAPKRRRKSAAKGDDTDNGEEKPARRTRRPRTRKADEGEASTPAEAADGEAVSADAQQSEEAAVAQG